MAEDLAVIGIVLTVAGWLAWSWWRAEQLAKKPRQPSVMEGFLQALGEKRDFHQDSPTEYGFIKVTEDSIEARYLDKTGTYSAINYFETRRKA